MKRSISVSQKKELEMSESNKKIKSEQSQQDIIYCLSLINTDYTVMEDQLFKDTIRIQEYDIANLVSVNLSGSTFNFNQIIALYESVKLHLPKLQILNLANCTTGDGFDMLICMLDMATTLKKLTLSTPSEDEHYYLSKHVSNTVEKLTISGPPCPIYKLSSMLSLCINKETMEHMYLKEIEISTNCYTSSACHNNQQQIMHCIKSIATSLINEQNTLSKITLYESAFSYYLTKILQQNIRSSNLENKYVEIKKAQSSENSIINIIPDDIIKLIPKLWLNLTIKPKAPCNVTINNMDFTQYNCISLWKEYKNNLLKNFNDLSEIIYVDLSNSHFSNEILADLFDTILNIGNTRYDNNIRTLNLENCRIDFTNQSPNVEFHGVNHKILQILLYFIHHCNNLENLILSNNQLNNHCCNKILNYISGNDEYLYSLKKLYLQNTGVTQIGPSLEKYNASNKNNFNYIHFLLMNLEILDISNDNFSLESILCLLSHYNDLLSYKNFDISIRPPLKILNIGNKIENNISSNNCNKAIVYLSELEKNISYESNIQPILELHSILENTQQTFAKLNI